MSRLLSRQARDNFKNMIPFLIILICSFLQTIVQEK